MIYDISADGKYALLHDFSRMKHAGTSYAGVPDPYESLKYTSKITIEKMDMETGTIQQLVNLEELTHLAFPNGYKGNTNLYFFREGWNPSGTRFITFLRNMDSPDRHISAWSISEDGMILDISTIIPAIMYGSMTRYYLREGILLKFMTMEVEKLKSHWFR